MKYGYLVSNQFAQNFVKWYLADPFDSKDKPYARKVLKKLQVTKSPAFKSDLDSINRHLDGFSNFKSLDIFNSSDLIAGNHKIYKKYFNPKTEEISATNYLRWLKSLSLTNTKSAISMIKKVDGKTLAKAHRLLKHISILVPQAKQEWKQITNKQIQIDKDKLSKEKQSLIKHKKILSHWYTSHLAKSDARHYVMGCKDEISNINDDIKDTKQAYQHKISIFNHLAKFGTKFSSDFYNALEKEYNAHLSHNVYINGKWVEYEPDQLIYYKGSVAVTLFDNNKVIQVKKPNADLSIRALYNTVIHLPYLNPKHISSNDCFTCDTTKVHVFGDHKHTYYLDNSYTFVPEYYHNASRNMFPISNFSDNNMVLDYKNFIQNNPKDNRKN